jgi:hypothetical protein
MVPRAVKVTHWEQAVTAAQPPQSRAAGTRKRRETNGILYRSYDDGGAPFGEIQGR